MSEISEFEQRRIATLKKEIIQDYDLNSQAKKIFSFETTQREDPSLIKIYQRPLFDRVWFSDPSCYPAYGSLGGAIARGEIDYIISGLKAGVEIPTIRESDLTIEWLRSIIASLTPAQNNISVVGSVENIYEKIIMRHDKWKASYDNVMKEFKIVVDGLGIPLYAVIKEILGDNIIVLNKECCAVKYQEFDYSDLQISSTLFVDIKPYETDLQKMDVLVHSTMKSDVSNRDLVKIFSLESVIGEPLVV
jgi:hypothetical protein